MSNNFSAANALVYTGAVISPIAVTPSDTATFAPGIQGTMFVCTVAGTVTIGFANGVSIAFPLATGLTLYPLAANQIYVNGTTATATYYAAN